MSEQLSYELYKWFTTIDVLPNTLRYKSNGNYELDSKSSEGLIGGYLVSKLLLHLANEHGATVNEPLISSIKQSSTPAAKVYNWNILTQSFTKLNITITKETQKEITSGNFNTLVKFLLDLHKKFNSRKIEKKEEPTNSEINLNKLQILESYEEAQNFLELAIMVISQSLSLTPKQTLSTLNDNAKYYAHMIVKGIKNSFAEIISMLDTFMAQIGKLLFLAEKSPEKNIQFFLDLVKPTLISRDIDVAKKGCQLFRKLIEQSLRYNSKNLIYQILCKESVGFDFLYMGLKRHPDLILEFTSFLFPLIREAFNDFFEIHLKRTINNEQEYLKIILRIIEGLTANPQSKGVLKQSGLLKVWLQNSQTSFERKKNKEENPVNQQTKILYLQLLCNLWKQYSTEVDQQYAEQLLIKGIQQLKKNTRKQIYTIKIPALLRLFDFLHYLAGNKNKVASILYKKLIFLFIENHDQEEIRQLILSNFKIVLQKFPTIPVQFLLDPFLKQLINSEGKTYILNVHDFEFMIELCKHPRMDASFALSYLQYLSKLYIKSFIYARLVIRVIEVLTSRFCQEQTIIQFLKKNIESTLNLYGILTFNKKKMSKEDSIMNKQKKSLAIQLIKHYAKLQHQELSNFIKEKVSALYLNWIQTKRHQNKGLKYLIQLYGDVEQVCLQTKVKQTLKKQEDFQKYQNQNQNLSEATLLENSNIQKPTPKSDTYRQLQYMQEKGIGYKGNKKSDKTVDNDVLDRALQKPNPTALQQLQKIKQKMKGQANRKKQLQDLQLKKIKQKNSANSIELFQRNLSLGYAKLTSQTDNQILFEFDTVKPKQLKLSIHFHSLEQLESIDKQSTKVILKNYSKDIKSLFLKYSLISSADSVRKEQTIPVMSFTEVIKMLNEKGLNFVNKLVVSDMISSINYSKRKERNILFGIQEPQFNQFLIKLTDYIIQNQPSSPEVPFGLRLEKLLKNLFANENFYENRFRIKESPNILQLRESLKNDQFAEQAVIPEGYKKIKQNQVDLIYSQIDLDWGVPQKKLIGYELADWLINRCLGFHIITPKIQIKQRYTLIQIPKPFKPKIPKQQTNPKIKYQNTQVPDQNNQFLSPSTPAGISEKAKKKQRMERRSQSQRAIHKPKTQIPIDEQQKLKNIKREKYVEKVKQNLQKLRKEKAIKEQADKKKEIQKKQLEKKKQQERQNYLIANKQKIAQYKKKENIQKNEKQEEEQKKKDAILQQQKKKEKQFLQKHKEDIKKRADVLSQKRKQLQNSKDKKLKQFQKLAKQVTVIKQDVQNDKIKMLQIKNSLQNGKLKTLADQFTKQFTDLYQSYWNWEKKRIELNSIALIFKDFKISPELIHPKVIAEVYKNVGKGQTLDYNQFIECVAKCAYKSPKIVQQNTSEQQNIEAKCFQKMITKLRMDEDNYKQVIKIVKHHLE